MLSRPAVHSDGRKTLRTLALALLVGVAFCLAPAAKAQSTTPQTPPATPAPQVKPVGVDVPVDYVLAKGDVITVTVMKHVEFSSDYTIPGNGPVDLLGVGPVVLQGMTLGDVAKTVNDSLKKRLRKPEVYVVVKVPRIDKVGVGGDVKTPGPLDYKKGWRLTQYIEAAGGIGSNLQMGDCQVIVNRADGTQTTYPLVDVYQNRNDANVEMKPDDSVVVISAETISVFISGEVTTPGTYLVRKDRAGVLQALSLAGGVKDDAALNKAKIVRANGDEVALDLGPAILRGEQATNLPKLQSGDLLLLPQIQEHFSVMGAVGTPGIIPMRDPKTPMRLSDAIALAKADPVHSRLSQVQLVRKVNGVEQRSVYDIGKYFKTGDPKQNPQIENGDVIYIPQGNENVVSKYASVVSVGAILFRLFSR